MDEQQYVALPKLYGAPAYARPPRPVETQERPFDPDDLPLEAFRTVEDSDLAASVDARPGAEDRLASAPVDQTVPGSALEPRPFSLKGLAHRIRPR